jgi:putative membrane protein
MMKIKNDVLLLLKGGAIGVANIIPGVSGGTIAVVLGIYEYLIEAISNFATNRKKRREYIIFLIKIAVGALTIIFLSAKLMKYLLEYYNIYTNLAFMGLIAGSIPSIYKSHHEMKINVASVITFIIGAGIILVFEFAFPGAEKGEAVEAVFSLTVNSAFLLAVSGFFAGGSMIVPGISGSFILLLMGQYYIVTSCVADRRIIPLGIVGIGVVLGIIVFAKIINVLLRKYPKETFYFILGLVIASLYSIYPGMPQQTVKIAIAIVITALCFFISFLIGRKTAK